MLSLALFIEDPLTHSVRSSFERKKKEHGLSSMQLGKFCSATPWCSLECWHSTRRRSNLKAALSLVKIPSALKVLRNCYYIAFISLPPDLLTVRI